MNRIPRKFNYIIATALSGNAEGHRMKITKDDFDYYGVEETGKTWRISISQLRNDHFFHIDKIVMEE